MPCVPCEGKGQYRVVNRNNGRLVWRNCPSCKKGKLRDIKRKLARNTTELDRATSQVKLLLTESDTLREEYLMIQLSKD